jgi:hypothetical protein
MMILFDGIDAMRYCIIIGRKLFVNKIKFYKNMQTGLQDDDF